MRTAFALMFLVVAACGDSSGGSSPDAGPDAGGPTTTVESFCAAFSERICDGLVACSCRFDVRGYDADGCVAARTQECIGGLGGALAADLASGAAVFDEDAVVACLDAVEAMAAACTLDTQSLTAPLPFECAGFVAASAGLDEACALSGGGLAFCADGAGVCLPDGCTALPGDGDGCLQGLCGDGLVCDGDTCREPRASGETCASPASCADGLVCDPGGHCAAPLAAAAVCTDTAQCAEGLACDDTGHCASLADLGDGCSNPSVCGAERSCGRAPETRTCTDPDADGAACEDGTCGTASLCSSSSGTCVALPGDTEACLDGFACAPGFTCVDGQGTCAPLPGLGETCAVGNRFCADGLGCRFSDNTCQPGPGEGEECLLNPPDYVCAAGLGCEFGPNASTCIPRTGAGTPCTNDRTCLDDTYCEFSTLECTTRLPDGSACNDGNECLAGSECEVRPGGPSCAPIPGRDEPCFTACTSGLVCKGPGGACTPALCTIP